AAGRLLLVHPRIAGDDCALLHYSSAPDAGNDYDHGELDGAGISSEHRAGHGASDSCIVEE
ncbi:MAG: hypothetical protein J4N99_03440, partial [Chloroflexi bacterium]|nr:hypothetical protein [Chloroflexota bacterium]